MVSLASLTLALMLCPIVFYVGGALASRRWGWAGARTAAVGALATSIAAVLLAGFSEPLPGSWLQTGSLAQVMSLLISFIALVIIRYSSHYLAGDAGVARYRFWLQLCLASVSVVVVANHLLLLWLAWTTISITLHQLLTYYPDRFRAVLAAHKKFLFARLAEACLLVAIVLLWLHHDTFEISAIVAAYPSATGLTLGEQVAAVLLAVAALIKCAQLPVHGWLIQVVECPTPVSALLHAGIINLGGYLMILMGPLLLQALAAQWLLLVAAGLTTVLSALIMMTRVSVKVKLAWSTSAQMGLMLVECALGLFELALLHLVAHSCYKAHAFLSSGSAVHYYLQNQLTPISPLNPRRLVVGLLLATGIVGAAALLVAPSLPAAPAGKFSLWLLVGIACAIYLSEHRPHKRRSGLLVTAAVVCVMVLAYVAQKTLFSLIITTEPTVNPLAAAWVCAVFLLLLAGYGALRYAPAHPVVQRFWVVLFAGLYLDEWVTRTTLRLWPVRLPPVAPSKKPLSDNLRSLVDERFA